MVFLKLLGYALGCVLMYWGVLLLLIAPLLAVIVLVALVNQVWNKVTGKEEEWQWFQAWFDGVGRLIHRWKFEWIGWVPGIFIQVWYAGYAAYLVQSSIVEASAWYEVSVHLMGVLSIVVAAFVFYGLYQKIIEVNLGRWAYWLVGVISLGAYFVFLGQPQVAGVLSESWQRVFIAVLGAFLEALWQ